MEMTVLDTIRAFQIEANDFVGFVTDGVSKTGIVKDVVDNGETMIISLIDDNDGDVIDYEVDANLSVSILGQEAVAI